MLLTVHISSYRYTWEVWKALKKLELFLTVPQGTVPFLSCSPNFLRTSITYYIISSVMHAFWLVLTYDWLEDRHIDDIIIKNFFNSLLYKTNRFQVAVCLFSNRSQRMSKCGKNISDTLGCTSCATFFVLTTLWRHLWSITYSSKTNIPTIRCIWSTYLSNTPKG